MLPSLFDDPGCKEPVQTCPSRSLAKNQGFTAAHHQQNTTPGFPQMVIWHQDLAWTTPSYRDELYDGYPWDLLRSNWPGATQVVISRLRQQVFDPEPLGLTFRLPSAARLPTDDQPIKHAEGREPHGFA